MKRSFENKYFVLSSSCVLTKGAKRTLIQDFQRHYVDFVPNEYYSLCHLLNRHRISEIAEQIDENSLTAFYHFVEMMLTKEYAFTTDDIRLFPPKKEIGDYEEKLLDAILEIRASTMHNTEIITFLSELRDLNCRYLQMRLYGFTKRTELLEWINTANEYNFSLIELHIDNADVLDYDACCDIILNYAPVSNIYLYHSGRDEVKPYNENTPRYYELEMGAVYYLTAELDSRRCGAVNKYCRTFGDERFYTMSQRFNNCLYKKVAMDMNGKVCNCPAMDDKFDISVGLVNIISSDRFQKYWSLTKDKVETCKDCEYRYNCLDCRVHTIDNNSLNKPCSCLYDPYADRRE